MSDERSFERFVADHVAGAAGSLRMPDDFYDDIHAIASRTRQRPEWLALIKEPPMRFGSTLGVGSPIARVTAIAAATLLLALLSAGALVAGAQSPSPTLPEAQAPSFFTGSPPDDACQIASPTTEVVDGVIRERGESWGCGVWTADDPRFSGESKVIWNLDAVMLPGSGRAEIVAARERIENADGAWEGTVTELQFGSDTVVVSGWFMGEGAYDSLAAYVVINDGKVRGVIQPDAGFGAPEAFADE
jgi:hypothetical protein